MSIGAECWACPPGSGTGHIAQVLDFMLDDDGYGDSSISTLPALTAGSVRGTLPVMGSQQLVPGSTPPERGLSEGANVRG